MARKHTLSRAVMVEETSIEIIDVLWRRRLEKNKNLTPHMQSLARDFDIVDHNGGK